jgi:hypothetical protein
MKLSQRMIRVSREHGSDQILTPGPLEAAAGWNLGFCVHHRAPEACFGRAKAIRLEIHLRAKVCGACQTFRHRMLDGSRAAFDFPEVVGHGEER